MVTIDPQSGIKMLADLLEPWQAAVTDPVKAQERVLHHLLKGYAKTDYGIEHGALNIDTLEDYRRAFPVATYADYEPVIKGVMAGARA